MAPSFWFRRRAAERAATRTSIAKRWPIKGVSASPARGHRGQGFQRARRRRFFAGAAGRPEDGHHHQAHFRNRGAAGARDLKIEHVYQEQQEKTVRLSWWT